MTIIRPAGPGDAGPISEVAREAYAPYAGRMGREPEPMTADYGMLIEAGGVFVAERSGAVAGLLVHHVGAGHLLLANVAVSPGAQGAGLGARLLAFTEDRAREFGLPEVRLYTNEAMVENITGRLPIARFSGRWCCRVRDSGQAMTRVQPTPRPWCSPLHHGYGTVLPCDGARCGESSAPGIHQSVVGSKEAIMTDITVTVSCHMP